MEAQMGPVGLIHQDGNPPGVGHGTDARRVADHPVVGGAGIDHQLHLRVLRQGLLHLLGGHGAGQAKGGLHRRQEKDRLQAADLHSVVDGLVAVAGQKDLVPPAGGRPDGG